MLSGLRAECDALSRQAETLRRMEEHFEGYNNSVRHVMQCCADGRLSAAGGCGRIYGPVSKLIEVGGEYVTAVETALGAAIQNIVVDDEDTVKAAIECLKRDRAGRATFCPVSAVKGYGGSVTREMTGALPRVCRCCFGACKVRSQIHRCHILSARQNGGVRQS